MKLLWIAQIFGGIGMICLFWSYQQNDRKRLIAGKLAADGMWVTHYLCLGAYGGAIPNFVGIFRELVFLHRGKKWADSVLWPLLFIGINWTLALTKANFPLSFLPIGASTFVTISLWVKKPQITRCIGAGVSIAFLIYDIFVHSWIGVINESVALVSIVSALWRKGKNDAADGK